jgi:hypothetical protein
LDLSDVIDAAEVEGLMGTSRALGNWRAVSQVNIIELEPLDFEADRTFAQPCPENLSLTQKASALSTEHTQKALERLTQAHSFFPRLRTANSEVGTICAKDFSWWLEMWPTNQAAQKCGIERIVGKLGGAVRKCESSFLVAENDIRAWLLTVQALFSQKTNGIGTIDLLWQFLHFPNF